MFDHGRHERSPPKKNPHTEVCGTAKSTERLGAIAATIDCQTSDAGHGDGTATVWASGTRDSKLKFRLSTPKLLPTRPGWALRRRMLTVIAVRKFHDVEVDCQTLGRAALASVGTAALVIKVDYAPTPLGCTANASGAGLS